ncbi:hypothetical protein [Pilimelia columellifera]|uniref:HEAT repeat domain-containing protein n=1 Tax=Pilimelia columellifera subsp. columellifera TaxID=706583 RepID=A0ABN3NHZ6_9ACTN
MKYQSPESDLPPDDVLAALAVGDPNAGVALIALALTYPDPDATLACIAVALSSPALPLRAQGLTALAHTVRLHRRVDAETLRLLRALPRGSSADDDLWTFVAWRRLPWWLWRYQLPRHLWWSIRNRMPYRRTSA